MKPRPTLWRKLSTRDGIYIGQVRLGRFKLVFHLLSGVKHGRLLREGLLDYNRFKPVYVSWGRRTQVAWERGFYNVRFYRLELIPFRVQLFATPAEVWEHWKVLKALRRAQAANEAKA